MYIDKATKGGKRGSEVFEKKTLSERLQFTVLGRLDKLHPHIRNIERLYDDPEYREKWVGEYQTFIL